MDLSSLVLEKMLMIDLSIPQEHQILRTTIREFLDKEIQPIINDYDREQKFIPPLKQMGELGILGVSIPEKYGGSGLDYLALAIVCEELERIDSSLRVVMSVHSGLNNLTLFQWATEEQKQEFLVPQAQGKKLATFGLTEPGNGSDVAALQTYAIRSGDEYILNGTKTWISLANTADHFLIIARLDREKRGTDNLAAFIVDRNESGVTTNAITGKLGIKTIDTGEITLDNVHVSQDNLIGNEGEGFKIAMSALDNGRFTVAAGAVGLIKACIESSVSYATSRNAFQREIGKFQLIQEHLAYMQASYDTSQLLVYKVAWMKNSGLRNTRETSMAKWIATNNALDAADRAIQIHGANGYSSDYSVERYWRNARGALIYEGTNEIQKLIQAGYVLGYRKYVPLRCDLPPA